MGRPLSEETKKRISEAHKRRFIEDVRNRDPKLEPTEKRCPGCGVTKPLEDFGIRKYKRASGLVAVLPRGRCKQCDAKRVAEWKRRKIEEGTWEEFAKRKKVKNSAKRKEYIREWKAAKRREEGAKPRGGRDSRVVVPVEPISGFLRQLEERHTREEIATRSGVEERRLYDIANCATPNTSLDNVDKLLMAFDREDLLDELYPLEDDGKEVIVGYYYLDPEGILKTDDLQVE